MKQLNKVGIKASFEATLSMLDSSRFPILKFGVSSVITISIATGRRACDYISLLNPRPQLGPDDPVG